MAEFTYRRIADALRRDIVDGVLAPGARIPSRHELARQYGVSDRVAVQAVGVLTAEGFTVGRSGSGTYVRQRPERQRLTRAWYASLHGSPFRADAERAGAAGTWESSTDRAPVTPAVAARLGTEPGQLAMRTVYTFLRDGEPVMLSTSWEPASLTSGTAIMFAEEGPHAGTGVVERMAAIGQHVIRAEEAVSARAALAAEAERLRIRPGATVLTIARTYFTGDMAVETADIVLPVERYTLIYEVPVGPPALTCRRRPLQDIEQPPDAAPQVLLQRAPPFRFRITVMSPD
jgi:DNA-binding GntR family transcriptional regulator